MLAAVRERHDIDLAMAKISETVTKPIPIGEEEAEVGLSMGVSVYPDDGGSIQEILGRADSEMYASKSEKKRVRLGDADGRPLGEPARPQDGNPQRKGRGGRR